MVAGIGWYCCLWCLDCLIPAAKVEYSIHQASDTVRWKRTEGSIPDWYCFSSGCLGSCCCLCWEGSFDLRRGTD